VPTGTKRSFPTVGSQRRRAATPRPEKDETTADGGGAAAVVVTEDDSTDPGARGAGGDAFKFGDARGEITVVPPLITGGKPAGGAAKGPAPIITVAPSKAGPPVGNEGRFKMTVPAAFAEDKYKKGGTEKAKNDEKPARPSLPTQRKGRRGAHDADCAVGLSCPHCARPPLHSTHWTWGQQMTRRRPQQGAPLAPAELAGKD
jgi:hypothetical protein